MDLYAHSKLPRLVQLIESLWVTYPFDTLNIVPGRPAQALEEHYAILQAIKARDAEAVAREMAAHLKSAQATLLATDGQSLAEHVLTK
jgi:DNA-binding GntR family transcriptional regulator